MNELMKMVKDCLTENNGESYCPFRVAGAALASSGIPTFLGCAVLSVWRHGAFDAVAFGTGFAAMMGGMAVLAGGVAMKARTDTP